MKTKNVKVRIKDIKHGRIIYTAHPFFGIDKTIVKSKPYMVKGIGLFYNCIKVYDDYNCDSSTSLCDNGIMSGESYNDRRSFFKEKQAIEYMNKMKTDKKVIKAQNKHEESCGNLILPLIISNPTASGLIRAITI